MSMPPRQAHHSHRAVKVSIEVGYRVGSQDAQRQNLTNLSSPDSTVKSTGIELPCKVDFPTPTMPVKKAAHSGQKHPTWLQGAAKLAVASVALYLVWRLAAQIGWSEVWRRMAEVGWAPIAVAAACLLGRHVMSRCTSAGRWH